MSLSRTVSEINGDFSRKSLIVPPPRISNAPADGVSFGIRYRRKDKKTRMIGYQIVKTF